MEENTKDKNVNYEMLIFDLDGTLWEASEITMTAANMVADKYPEIKKVDLELVNQIMGLSKDAIVEKLMPDIEHSRALGYLSMQIEKALELINKHGAHIYDGVSETIKYLSKKHKLGIVTNNFDEYAELFLQKSKLKKYFDDHIGTASYNITKSEAIKQIVSRNNASSACYIGDIKKDMIAAKEAGVGFVHAKYGFDKNLEVEPYINNIVELKELF